MRISALLMMILLFVSCNWTRTEEFVTYMRSAGELYLQGNDEDAMNALVKAEKAYSDEIPLSELGSLKMRKGDIYYRCYDYEKAIEYYLAAIEADVDGNALFLAECGKPDL